MDVIQTGTNIATVKISELPKSTETNGRATLATNEQTNQSEALELTKVAEATQTALDAAQTANQSSQTALASAATANQAAQNADTARENIAGDLAQKSSMFTGAIMGKGYFYTTDYISAVKNKPYTVVLCFKVPDTASRSQGIYDEGPSDGGGLYIYIDAQKQIRMIMRGGSVFPDPVNVSNDRICRIAISYDPNGDTLAFVNEKSATKGSSTFPNPHDPLRITIGTLYQSYIQYALKSAFVSYHLFDFAMTSEQLAETWNGGHPETWRVPDKYRNATDRSRCLIDLIPASLTPTVWKDISGQGSDIPYVPFSSSPAECEMAYENMGFPDTIIGTEAPAVIPNFIGQRYVDTTNKAAYTAYGTSSASDWK